MGRADQLDAALGDRPGGLGLELGPDLVDDDDLGHVVLDRLDHHLVLERRRPDLHPAGLADGRVRDVAVAGDLVRRVDDDDALAEVVGQDARGLAEHRGLADARPAHDQDRLPGLDEVPDDLDRPVDRPADPAGQADDLAVAVADRAMRWSVRSMPARLSSPNVPMWSTTYAMSASVDLAVEERRPRCPGSAPRGGAPGRARPRSAADLSGRAWTASTISGGSAAEQRSRSSIDFAVAFHRCHVASLRCGRSSDAGRHEGRLGDPDEGLLHQQGDGRDRVEAVVLQAPIDRVIRTSGPARSPRDRDGARRPSSSAPRSRPARTGRAARCRRRAGPGP